MSRNAERQQMKGLCPSKVWADEVDEMTNQQLTETQIRLQSKGRLGRKS